MDSSIKFQYPKWTNTYLTKSLLLILLPWIIHHSSSPSPNLLLKLKSMKSNKLSENFNSTSQSHTKLDLIHKCPITTIFIKSSQKGLLNLSTSMDKSSWSMFGQLGVDHAKNPCSITRKCSRKMPKHGRTKLE